MNTKYPILINLAIASATLIVCCILLRDVIIIGSTDNYDYKILQSDYAGHIYTSCLSDGNTIEAPQFKEYIEKRHLSDKFFLVVKYSDLSCSSCMDYVLANLKSIYQITKIISVYCSLPRILSGEMVKSMAILYMFMTVRILVMRWTAPIYHSCLSTTAVL